MASLDLSMVFAMDDEEAYGFYENIDDTEDDASAPHLVASVRSYEDEDSLTHCYSRIVDDNAASLHTSPPILSHRAVETLCESLPPSLQDRRFLRLFSTSRDGASFATFMRRVRARDSTVIVVKTSSGRIIGGYASNLWSGRSGRGKRTSSANQCFLFEVRQSKAQSSSFIPGYEEFSSSPTSTTLDFDFGNLSMQDFSPKVDVMRTPRDSRLEQVCHLTQKYLSLCDTNYTLILEDSFASGMVCLDGATLEAITVTEFEVYDVS